MASNQENFWKGNFGKIYSRRNKNSNKEISYKVRYGDSLSKISYKYGVRVTDIRNWNGLKDDLIKVGQHLIIKTKN